MDKTPRKRKNKAAVALGRKRALSMSPDERRALAKLAIETRWAKERERKG